MKRPSNRRLKILPFSRGGAGGGLLAPFLAGALVAAVAFFTAATECRALTAHSKYAAEPLATCNDCHNDLNVAPNHGVLWTTEHRPYALRSDSNCKQCHEQRFCVECHIGGRMDADLNLSNFGPDYAPKSHRTDFREMHPIKAKDDPNSCYRCHNAERFCGECHSKFGGSDLAILSHRKGWSDLTVGQAGPMHSTFGQSQCQQCHPNSLLPKHQWSDQHAREARQNLASCQTCHADGVVCLTCHSATSGLKSNPHPQGWSKIADKMRAASGSRTCNVCH